MFIRIAACLLLVSLISSPLLAQNKKKTAKPVTVFTVHAKPVTAEEFIYLYRKNHPNKEEDYTKEKIEEYLTLFINFKLKVEEARQRGLDTTVVFKREFDQYHDELRKPYLPDAKLTDSLVHLTYERMKEEISASHILISVKPDASPEDTLKAYNKIIDIRNKIVTGEDFAKAAAQYSEDPGGKINGGDLGYFTALQMVYSFETVAYQTRVGEISKPVRSQFGYHLIRVADRRPSVGEVEVSHIMIRIGEGKDDAKAKNSIFDAYDELQAGVKWEDVVQQFSEDPGSRENGGRLRPFGARAMANVPEFERVAFSLKKPGDISDPFQTQYGWHIIRLEKKIPLAPLEELSTTLKGRVNRDDRTQVSKQALEMKLRKEFQFAENSATKTKVIALADTSLKKAHWKPAHPSFAKETLFTLQSKKYTAEDFVTYARKNQRPNSLAPEKYLEQLYNQFVHTTIVDLLEEKIIRNNPDYSYLLSEYYEGILLFEIMEKEVWNKASDDSVGQHRYYDANVQKYQAGERAKATFYYASTPAFTESLTALVKQGNEVMIQEYVTANKIKTENGYYKKEDKAVLQKVAWAPGVYSAENNGMYYLAWLKDILPAGAMSFEEARASVISDYQAYVEKTWIDQLKKKYPVKVNEKGKRYILQNLQQK